MFSFSSECFVFLLLIKNKNVRYRAQNYDFTYVHTSVEAGISALRGECRVKVSNTVATRKLFRPKRDEVTGHW